MLSVNRRGICALHSCRHRHKCVMLRASDKSGGALAQIRPKGMSRHGRQLIQEYGERAAPLVSRLVPRIHQASIDRGPALMIAHAFQQAGSTRFSTLQNRCAQQHPALAAFLPGYALWHPRMQSRKVALLP